MKEIISRNKYIILVDDEDYEWLNKYTWRVRKSPSGTKFYAYTQSKKKYLGGVTTMHRLVLGLIREKRKLEIVDHINRDGLDNRKENLRKVTKQQNEMNSDIRKNNKTGYKGVSFRKDTRKYRSYIAIDGKQINLGCYNLPEDAAIAHDKEVLKLFPNHAYTNFPKENYF
jgi:hypothetical protein